MADLFYTPKAEPDQTLVLLAELTRMGGRPHLATWILEGADVEALKKKTIEQIEQNLKPGGAWHSWAQAPYRAEELLKAVGQIVPEFFRTIDWVATQIVHTHDIRHTPMSAMWDLVDFANGYLGPVLMALKAKNKPWPQLKSKEFDLEAATKFVAENGHLLKSGLIGPYDEADTTVYEFDNGWRIAELAAENVEREGDEMNNCLSDNDSYYWTDKAEQGYIAVLSLRDPLNRPHVSAAVRYNDWLAGHLVYTEGPLLKNNRPLEEDPRYAEMWRQFTSWIESKGGDISSGDDGWDDDGVEEPYHAPYHAESLDAYDYGDELYVNDLWDLKTRWDEAREGCRDWGEREAEQVDNDDGDGDLYYYFETYGGREVVSDESGLMEAVEEWINDPDLMRPEDFVGAVVFWATVLHRIGVDSSILTRLAHKIFDTYDGSAHPKLLMWVAENLLSERSINALKDTYVPMASYSQRTLDYTSFFLPTTTWREREPAQPDPQQPQQQLQFPTESPQQQPQPQPQQPQLPLETPPGQQPPQQQPAPTTEGQVDTIRRLWLQNQTPEYLNELGEQLINSGVGAEQAAVLQQATGQQVGFRQGKILRVADNGSTADYPEDWFEQEEEQPEEFGEPWSPVPKYEPGDNVICRTTNAPASIVREAEQFEGGWWYAVLSPSGQTYQVPEELLGRPDGYDEPGESTLNDWMGIPPEGEQYYRTASDGWDEVFQAAPMNTDHRNPFAFIYSPSAKWVKWTGPNGGHEEIENDMRRSGETIPSDAYYGRYYPGDRDPVQIYGPQFSAQPWSYQKAVQSLIRLNAPDSPDPGAKLCPACGGYLEKRGEDVYTCQKCPYELPAGGESVSTED